jgi:hypothetical protein
VTFSAAIERYVDPVDEARRVLDRLTRIDRLRQAHASPAVILREVQALLEEGEAWRDAERAGERDEHSPNGRRAAATGRPAGASRDLPDPSGAATDAGRSVADRADAEPIRKAADALARLDAALAHRAVDARGGEVVPKRQT